MTENRKKLSPAKEPGYEGQITTASVEAALVAVRYACEGRNEREMAKAILDARLVGESVVQERDLYRERAIAADGAIALWAEKYAELERRHERLRSAGRGVTVGGLRWPNEVQKVVAVAVSALADELSEQWKSTSLASIGDLEQVRKAAQEVNDAHAGYQRRLIEPRLDRALVALYQALEAVSPTANESSPPGEQHGKEGP